MKSPVFVFLGYCYKSRTDLPSFRVPYSSHRVHSNPVPSLWSLTPCGLRITPSKPNLTEPAPTVWKPQISTQPLPAGTDMAVGTQRSSWKLSPLSLLSPIGCELTYSNFAPWLNGTCPDLKVTHVELIQ